MVRLAHAVREALADSYFIVDAAQALFDELRTILNEASADFAASAGEVVEGVEVEAAGDLEDDS